jgi:hypothetical protein
LGAIGSESKYVNLDLSACTVGGTEFNPGTADTGESFIVSLVFPAEATILKAGTVSDPTFQHFVALKSVSGANIGSVGQCAFEGCISLSSVDLPKATTINGTAFEGCTSLSLVNLPKATNIGTLAFGGCIGLTTVSLPEAVTIDVRAFEYCTALSSVNLSAVTDIGTKAFAYTGTGNLTVTLGSAAPQLGTELFSNVSLPKSVIVKVPSGATGYGASPTDTSTVCWGNGFRGGGWTGSAFQIGGASYVNSNVDLTIETYTP